MLKGVNLMYGITKELRKYGLEKIKKQKNFLNSNFFQIGNENIPMSLLVKNAYHNSDKYIAEVNQRVYSLFHYANNKGLKNIFGTITLPSKYHKYKTLSNGRLVKNPKYSNLSPNDGAKELSKMFKALLDTRAYKSINKSDKCYFRVYEPHKNGTPHLHFSMFVPADKLEKVSQTFKNYFDNNYPTLRVDFQTDINNPVAYLMKYILKTFDDLREDENNITDLSLWYIVNRITRFYTSRTLISLEVYRKLNGRYNLLELTEMYRNKQLSVLVDIDTNKVVSIHDNVGNIYNKKDTQIKSINSFKVEPKLKIKRKEDRKKEPIIMIDDKRYVSINGQLQEYIPTVNKMNDIQLHKHYRDLEEDIYNINMQHYCLIKNELIDRDILHDEKLPINQYTVDLQLEYENSF